MHKNGRDVLARFKEAGLDVEVQLRKKHYLVFLGDELVFKFSKGRSSRWRDERNLDNTIRRLKRSR